MTDNPLYDIAVWLLPLVIAIVFHEIAHGLVAKRLGDPTASERGRLSLNPIRHIDPFGTVILPLILALSSAGAIFGWAKPVPVDFRRLRSPRRDMIVVALAGPGMNLVLGIVGALVLAVTFAVAQGELTGAAGFVAANALNFIYINIFLGVFNLLPIPPFDGGHVAEGLLPRRLARSYRKIGRYALLVFITLLLVLPAISPSADIVGRVVSPIVDWLARNLLWIVGIRP